MSHENTTPQIDKYDNHKKNYAFQTWHTLQKNAQKLFAKGWVECFLKGSS